MLLALVDALFVDEVCVLWVEHHQWGQFEQHATDDFVRRLERLVLAVRPGVLEHADTDARATFFQRLVSEADTMGFRTEFEVAVFTTLTVLNGPAWYRDPSHALYDAGWRRGVSAWCRANTLLNLVAGTVAQPAPRRPAIGGFTAHPLNRQPPSNSARTPRG